MKLVITMTDGDGRVLEQEVVTLKTRTEEVVRNNVNSSWCPKVTVQLQWLEELASAVIPPGRRP